MSRAAIDKWKEALGDQYVIDSGDQLKAVQKATFSTPSKPLCILKPIDREDIKTCIRIAREHGIPLYPVSGGRNYGYGSRTPYHNSALLSLENLSSIIDYDERKGYITIEPGVTFYQLSKFLIERASKLLIIAPGSTGHASVIGNTLERGFGQGGQSDRASHVCGLEIITGTEETIKTGYGTLKNAKSQRLHKWGIGPSFDGLFFQSNLGIVTQMTFWLPKRPKYYQPFHFSIHSVDRLATLLDELAALKQEGLVPVTIGLFNKYRLITYTGHYYQSKGQLENYIQEILGPGEWYGQASVEAADERILAVHRELIDQRLSPLVDELIWEESNAPSPFYDIHPSEGLYSTYWRKQVITNPENQNDPDGDECGTIMLNSIIPFSSDELIISIQKIESIIQSYTLEPTISLQAMDHRVVHVIITLHYDLAIPDEDQNAKNCSKELLNSLATLGHYPYRTGVM